MFKSIINFFRERFDYHFYVGLAIMAIVIIALIALNAYVLDMTRGHYNAFEILFL